MDNIESFTSCVICMEDCLLPVEFVCFPCFSTSRIHCHSFKRTCFFCSIKYLELDQSSLDRSFFKKCLFCASIVYLHHLTIEKSFKVDFPLMIKDHLSAHVCKLCNMYVGTQLNVYKHLQNDCPMFWIECECKKIFKRIDIFFHQYSCDRYHFCPLCSKHVLVKEVSDHFRHVHDLILCNLCKIHIPQEFFDAHVTNECLERLVSCEYCSQLINFSKLNEHLEDHLDLVLQELDQLKKKYREIMKKYSILKKLLRPLNSFLT